MDLDVFSLFFLKKKHKLKKNTKKNVNRFLISTPLDLLTNQDLFQEIPEVVATKIQKETLIAFLITNN